MQNSHDMEGIIFHRSLKPVSEEVIRIFEQSIGFTLPPDYRKFLLRWNGGLPNKPVGQSFYIQFLFGLSEQPVSDSIRSTSPGIPPEFLSIGFCGGTEYVWLNLLSGKIYVRDGQCDYDSPAMPLAEQFRLVEESFTDLIRSLGGDSEFDVPEDEICCIGRWADIAILEQSLARGRDINEQTSDGYCIVKAAIAEGEVEFVKECVMRGAILQKRGLLHAAAFSGGMNAVAYLLERGLDPNEIEDGRTPLDCTFGSQDWLKVRELLVERGGRYSNSDDGSISL